jgi:hypothetical protein
MHNLLKLLGNWLRTLKAMRHDNKRLSTLKDLNVTLEKPSTDFPLFLVILFLFAYAYTYTDDFSRFLGRRERTFPHGRTCTRGLSPHLVGSAAGSRLYDASLVRGAAVRGAPGTLPESKALPSVAIFAECLLSGTRQRRLCRVPHSVKLNSRQRGSLPSAGHSAQVDTRHRLVCRVSNTRQRGLSAKGRQRPSQS